MERTPERRCNGIITRATPLSIESVGVGLDYWCRYGGWWVQCLS